MRFTRRPLLLASAILVLALLALATLQGDLLEEFADIRPLFFSLLDHFGVLGSLLLLYLEESGLPLPLPGDAILIYLGARSPLAFPFTLALVALVISAGASNLYFISSRLAPRALASNAFAAFFYLSADRTARARSWFARWGVLALIFGRHVPGLRIPLTIVAGSLRLPYRLFLPSIMLSSTLWAALWLTLGARYAHYVETFLLAHSWLYLLGVVATLAFLSVSTLRVLRAH